MGIPGTRHVPCRQPAGLAARSQTVVAFITEGAVHGVFALIRIGGIGKEGCRTASGLFQLIVIGILLYGLLEEFVGVEGHLTLVVLHADAVERVHLAIDGTYLCTREEVDDMAVIEHIVPRGRETEVGAHHLVVLLLVDAAFG